MLSEAPHSAAVMLYCHMQHAVLEKLKHMLHLDAGLKSVSCKHVPASSQPMLALGSSVCSQTWPFASSMLLYNAVSPQSACRPSLVLGALGMHARHA